MEAKKIAVQVVVAMVLFIIVSLILEGAYTQEVIIEKAKTALLFGLAYTIFILVKSKFKNKSK